MHDGEVAFVVDPQRDRGRRRRAQRELVRIGIDRPAAAAAGTPADWVAGTGWNAASFARATFADLAQVRHHRAVTVLGVRRAEEFDASAIRGAVNIPLHELPGRIGAVAAGEVWVHCAAGYRASIAASLLAVAGRRVVAVDDAFGNARQSARQATTGSLVVVGAIWVIAALTAAAGILVAARMYETRPGGPGQPRRSRSSRPRQS